MVSIVIDPSYAKGIWSKKLQSVLTARLKEKRISYEMVSDADGISGEIQYAFLIGADITWARYSISACNLRGIHPILLCNRSYLSLTDTPYSQVCTDIMGSMHDLIAALRDTGHRRLALYGINRQSIADASLLNGYLATADEASRKNVFYNDGNFEKCYRDFMAEAPDVDGIICANDFLGISLVRHFEESSPERFLGTAIISNTDLQLTKLYSDRLISVKHHSSEYGKAAVMMLETLQRNTYLSAITMSLKWDCSSLYDAYGAKRNLSSAVPDLSSVKYPEKDIFYSDTELSEMMKVEQILFESDEIDRIVIGELMKGSSYEDISERNFLAINTVKYHVKKMLEICGLDKKSELVRLLKKYIPE